VVYILELCHEYQNHVVQGLDLIGNNGKGNRPLSRYGVTVDGVGNGNWIYLTLNTCGYTLQFTVTQRLVLFVTLFTVPLHNIFQQ
jgi:hypothetical protein